MKSGSSFCFKEIHILPVYSRVKCTIRSPLATAIKSPTGDTEMWHSCNQHCNSVSSLSTSWPSSFQPQSKSSHSPIVSAHHHKHWSILKRSQQHQQKQIQIHKNHTVYYFWVSFDFCLTGQFFKLIQVSSLLMAKIIIITRLITKQEIGLWNEVSVPLRTILVKFNPH